MAKLAEKSTERSKLSDLEEICGDDKEVYEALLETMYLDPRKIKITIDQALDKAKDFEKEKNAHRARVMYDIAGGLAIYEGNAVKVKQFFSKSSKLNPDYPYPILNVTERAITRAKEFYDKHLKEEHAPTS
ncbi:MAG TPA: hypothetical protein VK487_07325 [Candidatus Bathyarchaeia archaeon]|nr:hypothetical protein [Candidatus Bathyarchaeia archaeon]